MSTSGVFSTSGGYHDACGDIMSTSEDVQYIGGCSVHRADIRMHVGDTMSTSGDVQYIGGYHEYIGGCSVHWGFQG